MKLSEASLVLLTFLSFLLGENYYAFASPVATPTIYCKSCAAPSEAPSKAAKSAKNKSAKSAKNKSAKSAKKSAKFQRD